MSAASLRTSFAIAGPSGSNRGYEHRPPREPWLMVPRDGTRAVTLNVDGGHHVAIRNADNQGVIRNYLGLPVCRARIAGNQLFIQGLGNGRDVPIDLVQGGRALRLIVSVKFRKTLPIIAHYVEHGPLLKTRMTRELLRAVIDQANAVYYQANIRLLLALESVLTHERIFPPKPAAKDTGSRNPAKSSLGRVVDYNEESQLIKKHRFALPYREFVEYPPLNVFFVREVERKDKTKKGEKDPHELAITDNQGNCIFEDPPADARSIMGKIGGKVLAHEAGHHLLYAAGIYGEHHVSDPYNLMNPEDARLQGSWLTRDQIETINPSNTFKAYDGTTKAVPVVSG